MYVEPLRRLEKSRRLSTAVACLVFLASFACGKDDNDSTGGSVTIRGGERLAWDQAAESAQQVGALSFRLYANGSPATLADTRCSDVVRSGTYECSGLLPAFSAGRYTLELTSVLNGEESQRSGPMTVIVSASLSQPAIATATSSANTSIADVACSTRPDRDSLCYDVRIVASGLGDVIALTSGPGERAWLVEDGRTVRVISRAELLPSPALELTDLNARIVGMTLDHDFLRTKFVFVAWTESVRGAPVLNVTRYRELQNTFGEAATIVSGLPFRVGAFAPLAVDGEGRLVVAAPSLDESQSGVISRFTRDGFAARENPSAAPALAEGYASIEPGLARLPHLGRRCKAECCRRTDQSHPSSGKSSAPRRQARTRRMGVRSRAPRCRSRTRLTRMRRAGSSSWPEGDSS
jgi:hypothetical protein